MNLEFNLMDFGLWNECISAWPDHAHGVISFIVLPTPPTNRCYISLNVNGVFQEYGIHNGINVSDARTTTWHNSPEIDRIMAKEDIRQSSKR